jgi:hypothetical protein
MSTKVPPPLAVLLGTSNESSISVLSTSPLLAELSVGSTKTWNDDFEVAD